MSARDEILAVRRSLHVTGEEAPRRAAAAARLAEAPAGVIPRRGQGDARARLATFKAEAALAQASVAEVAAAADVPAAVVTFLRENNLPATLRMGEDARLTAMPWGAAALEISRGPSDGDDPNAVSAAVAAVAETGTVALVSGPDNPTTLAFLPDNHVVVVFADDLVGDYESVFVKLRAAYGVGAAPRTVNFITGPSRSADIEQTLLLGAHGPRRLHIVVVGALPEADAAEAAAEK
jgi:L-lactate dehydrogenase complex protein LldG